jgi:Transposase DDE domain group 1
VDDREPRPLPHREAMAWCEEIAGVDYIFGHGGNPGLADIVRPTADALCVERAVSGVEKVRCWRALRDGAKSWRRERSIVARIEATKLGVDVRYVVTSRARPGASTSRSPRASLREARAYVSGCRRPDRIAQLLAGRFAVAGP